MRPANIADRIPRRPFFRSCAFTNSNTARNVPFVFGAMSSIFSGRNSACRLSRSTSAAVMSSSDIFSPSHIQRRASPPRMNAENTEYDDVRCSATICATRCPSDDVTSRVSDGSCTSMPLAFIAVAISGNISGSATQRAGHASSGLTSANTAAMRAASSAAVAHGVICESAGERALAPANAVGSSKRRISSIPGHEGLNSFIAEMRSFLPRLPSAAQ